MKAPAGSQLPCCCPKARSTSQGMYWRTPVSRIVGVPVVAQAAVLGCTELNMVSLPLSRISRIASCRSSGIDVQRPCSASASHCPGTAPGSWRRRRRRRPWRRWADRRRTPSPACSRTGLLLEPPNAGQTPAPQRRSVDVLDQDVDAEVCRPARFRRGTASPWRRPFAGVSGTSLPSMRSATCSDCSTGSTWITPAPACWTARC